ncbi:MAG: hypothetical protein Q9M91_02595 [Candidatus Dojkabacteria bacterium]|nr:hypothetical protein [Candidatus Dojkabacteria bacterium]
MKYQLRLILGSDTVLANFDGYIILAEDRSIIDEDLSFSLNIIDYELDVLNGLGEINADCIARYLFTFNS